MGDQTGVEQAVHERVTAGGGRSPAVQYALAGVLVRTWPDADATGAARALLRGRYAEEVSMRATVTEIDGRLVPECPGASRMHLEFDPITVLLTMTCPFCGKRTLRYLVAGDEFEVNHRKSCRLARTVRRIEAHLEAHPGLVGQGAVFGVR